jgi:hypothetical protein
LSKNVSIINWPLDKAELDLSRGASLHELVAGKIAFEFLALLSGTVICKDVPQLTGIRHALMECHHGSEVFNVERLLAPDYAPIHGICFEGNQPHATIQVRLFGKLAFRVHFRRLALSQPKIVYTHYLKSGEEYVRELP